MLTDTLGVVRLGNIVYNPPFIYLLICQLKSIIPFFYVASALENHWLFPTTPPVLILKLDDFSFSDDHIMTTEFSKSFLLVMSEKMA